MNDIEMTKSLVGAQMDAATTLAREIWEYAELAYEEVKSAAVLIEALKKEGFTIEEGIAGIPTAFVASYVCGSGRPRMAFLAEYDALSGLSQCAATREFEPVTPGGAGHGCGHNLLGAGCYAAAIALKEYLIREKKDGCVLFFGPAGDCLRDYFGSSGSRKSAESYIIVIMNVQRGFFGRNNFKTHIRIFSILIFPIQYFRSDNSPP